MTNVPEQRYLDLLRRIIIHGDKRTTRNATTRSVFGVSLSFNIRKYGFPLLTTKRVWFRGVVEELLWFLRGDTNAKNLSSKDVHIWDKNTSRKFLDSRGLHWQEGDAGPVYGFQWRHFNATYSGCDANYAKQGIDQLQQIITTIENNPTSRRLVMTAWNPCQNSDMCLPPCHVLYQFYVSSDGHLDCQLYQRSADMFLGLPFNIASTALLTTIIANTTGLAVGKITVVIGDAHIYESHVSLVRKQLTRSPLPFPKIRVKNVRDVDKYTVDDIEVANYVHQGTIKAKMIA